MIAWRLDVFEELGSTSDFCAAQAKAGAPEGLAVVALKQSAGRGSRGRAWVAPPGNLNLSVLLRPKIPANEAGLFSLLAGIAVAEAMAPYTATPPMLKWPNDILLAGEKLGGILIDAVPAGLQLGWIVIGIGVNLLTAPQMPRPGATCLALHGSELAPRHAAAAVLEKLGVWYGAPAETIRQAWLGLAHPLGTPLIIQSQQETRRGHFAGLSPAGELLLRTENGIEIFNTGDILLGRA